MYSSFCLLYLLVKEDNFIETSSSRWWFQPIWKIWSSNSIISPGFGVKIKNIWHHHLVIYIIYSAIFASTGLVPFVPCPTWPFTLATAPLGIELPIAKILPTAWCNSANSVGGCRAALKIENMAFFAGKKMHLKFACFLMFCSFSKISYNKKHRKFPGIWLIWWRYTLVETWGSKWSFFPDLNKAILERSMILRVWRPPVLRIKNSTNFSQVFSRHKGVGIYWVYPLLKELGYHPKHTTIFPMIDERTLKYEKIWKVKLDN